MGCDAHYKASSDCFRHFNPRTPRGVRPGNVIMACLLHLFQSTHPAWGATSSLDIVCPNATISIHAPRVGCDLRQISPQRVRRDFNPRTPRGVRPLYPSAEADGKEFQSTHPAWGATNGKGLSWTIFLFQSTHPAWGATLGTRPPMPRRHFNPRTPRGVRR